MIFFPKTSCTENAPIADFRGGGIACPSFKRLDGELYVSLLRIRRWMHFYAGYDAHGDKQGQHGGAAVAEEGQGQTNNGHQTQAHSDIDENLKQQHAGDPNTDLPIKIALGVGADVDDAQNDGSEQGNTQETAQEAQFLANHSEYKVRVLGRNGVGLGLCALVEALPGKSTAGDGVDGALGLIADANSGGIDGLVKENQN